MPFHYSCNTLCHVFSFFSHTTAAAGLHDLQLCRNSQRSSSPLSQKTSSAPEPGRGINLVHKLTLTRYMCIYIYMFIAMYSKVHVHVHVRYFWLICLLYCHASLSQFSSHATHSLVTTTTDNKWLQALILSHTYFTHSPVTPLTQLAFKNDNPTRQLDIWQWLCLLYGYNTRSCCYHHTSRPHFS